MAKPTRATQDKRKRERMKQERKEEKRVKREIRKEQRREDALLAGDGAGIDPDLIGIVPGPQPPQE